MTLRSKLVFYMIIPTLLLGIMGVVGIFSLKHLGRAAGRILDENYRSIQAARNMERILRSIESTLHRPRRGRESFAPSIAAFLVELRRCEQAISEPDEKQLFRRVQRQWSELSKALTRVPTSIRGEDFQQYFGDIFRDIDSIISVNERAMSLREVKTRRVGRWMEIAVGASLAAAMLALVLFALVAARRISRPITQIADRLHGALNPELSPGLDERAQGGNPKTDEIARLRLELEALLARLGHYESEQNQRFDDLQGRLASIINEVLEGLLLLDGRRRVLAINQVAQAILGPEIAEGSQLELGRLGDDVGASLAPVIDGTAENEQDLEDIQRELGGEIRHYRPRILSVRSSDPQSQGHLVIFWDITEQVRFDEARRGFISTLSHQLKTPITSLAMSVNLLHERMRKDGAPPEHELLEIAKENCAVLSSLVSELISASREMRPNLSYEKRRLDVREVLDHVLRPLGKMAQDKGIVVDNPSVLQPLWVQADATKLSWVLTNVIGNALQHTPSLGRISIDASSDDGQVTVGISDTGAGIPQEQLESIFLPFVSLQRDSGQGSHGLGLAIAREIMERHGGTIRAESRGGEGSTFWIKLPFDRGESDESDSRG